MKLKLKEMDSFLGVNKQYYDGLLKKTQDRHEAQLKEQATNLAQFKEQSQKDFQGALLKIKEEYAIVVQRKEDAVLSLKEKLVKTESDFREKEATMRLLIDQADKSDEIRMLFHQQVTMRQEFQVKEDQWMDLREKDLKRIEDLKKLLSQAKKEAKAKEQS